MAMNSLLNRTLETLRGGVGQASRAGRGAASQGAALGRRLANRNPDPKPGMDDATLARKVETEILRPKGAPKGKVDVNAVDGVVWLRGEVKNQAASKALETQVRAIPEVKEVENLLHLPKTPAPSRSRAGTKKTAAAKETRERRFERQAGSAEKPKASARDPLPSQAAATRSGRKAAPLGSKDPAAAAKPSPASATGGVTPAPATGSDDPGPGSAS